MPNDKYYNKVVWDNQTLIDLTSDTVTAGSLLRGVTAHGANGQPLTGTLDVGNYVTLDTVQSISAEKTFEAGLWASSSFSHTSIYPNSLSLYSNHSREGLMGNRHIADVTSEGFYIYTEGSSSQVLSKVDRLSADLGTHLNILGTDLNLRTTGSDSNDSGDIVWWYGNGQEKARIWTDNLPTTNTGLNYRAYDSDGLLLANGKIITSSTASSITFEGVTAPIKFKGAYATTDMIKFKDGVDQYGSGLILGGGGLTVIGGGESADVIASTRGGGTEELHLASDGAVALWTNVQNGEASAKKFLFNSSGDLEAPRYVKCTYLSSSANVENSYITSASSVMYCNSDNWVRKTEISNFNSFINPFEGKLQFGGGNWTATGSGGYGPVDMGIVNEFSSNRFAGIPAAAVTVEYSRNAGSTWTAYSTTDANKRALFTTQTGYAIGAADSTNKATANGDKYQLRVTIDTSAGQVYTALKKFAIQVSTGGSYGTQVSIYKAKNSSPTSFETVVENADVTGWSGWNIINVPEFTTYGNSSSQYQKIRFIFKANGGNTSYNGMSVMSIYGYGGFGWTTPSILAKKNRCYDYDEALNVTFPANVTGAYFRETSGVENGQFSVTSNIMFANSDNYLRKTSWTNMVAQLRGAFVSLRSGTTLVSSDSRVIIDEGSYMVIGTNPGSGTAQAICILTMRLHASADTSTRIYFCNQMPKPIAPVGIIPISYTTGKTANAAWYYIGTNGQGISNTGTIYKNEGHCISVAYVTALI